MWSGGQWIGGPKPVIANGALKNVRACMFNFGLLCRSWWVQGESRSDPGFGPTQLKTFALTFLAFGCGAVLGGSWGGLGAVLGRPRLVWGHPI